MRPNSRLTILLLMFLAIASAYGQRTELKKAKEYLVEEEYYRALEYYQLASSKGATLNTQAKLEMARCYFHLKNITQALGLYEELKDHLEVEDMVNFASCWQQSNGPELAIEWYNKAIKEGANPIDMNDLIKSCQWAMDNDAFDADVRVNPCQSVNWRSIIRNSVL